MSNTHENKLLQAVLKSDLEGVTGLLQQGLNPNVRDPQSGLTALMIASGYGDVQIVKALLESGADVFAIDSKAGATALHKACQAGSLEVVKLLAEAGAFIDEPTTWTGHTPLIEAIWFKWPDIVAYLLERGAGLNVKTRYGFSLLDHLQYALKVNVIGKDKLLHIEELVKARKKSDEDAIKNQKLMAAVNNGDLNEVKKLIAEGADIEERSPMLNGFNDYHTPLLVACRDGHLEIAEELIKAGADVNATEPTFGAVPLHKATYNGHIEITKLLADQPRINLDFQGPSNGYTPLHDALWHGFAECSEILVNAGARLDLKGHDGKIPLDIALTMFEPDHSIVKLIKSKM